MNAYNKYAYRMLTIVALAMLAGGTIFYHLVEKWKILDAYYFCVVTLSTVGYGDLTPRTDIGKLFTTFYILVGIGIIAAFASAFIKRQGLRAKNRYETKHKQ